MAHNSTQRTNGGNDHYDDNDVANDNGKGAREIVPRGAGRGFAAMDPARRRLVSSVGGKAAHLKGTGHEFTREEARAAGQKGGRASAVARATRLRSLDRGAAPSPTAPAEPAAADDDEE